jgi:hypothetical protein
VPQMEIKKRKGDDFLQLLENRPNFTLPIATARFQSNGPEVAHCSFAWYFSSRLRMVLRPHGDILSLSCQSQA